MTSRELVYQTLSYKNYNGRVPRNLWRLPWIEINDPEGLRKLVSDFKWDITWAPAEYKQAPNTKGNPYRIGQHIDAWGCIFKNIHEGVHGEVEEALVKDDDWNDVGNVHIPEEMLTFDSDAVNRFCANTDQFIIAGGVANPFERLQYIRGSQNLFVDLIDRPEKMKEFVWRMHDFYCRLLEKWAKTDIDALQLMDDWGSQNSLLINPDLWEDMFKPLYRDYAEIAKTHNKKIFMHSDGYTLSIIPHLIEIGIDALNAQIFCMGIENLAQFKGKITFWGEIDRQYLLPHGTPEELDAAVDLIFNTLWDNGGCIAQLELGPLGKTENARRVFDRFITHS